MQLIDAHAYCEECGEKRNYPNSMTCKHCRIERAPRIDAKIIQHGHWITVRQGKTFKEIRCSNCHIEYRFNPLKDIELDNYFFCPFCGAEMHPANENKNISSIPQPTQQ